MTDFAPAEYQARQAAAQAWMADDGIDAVLFSTEAEIRYYTGFRTAFWQSPTRPWYLILPQSGRPIAVIPGIGADLMARAGVRDIRSWASPAGAQDGLALLQEVLLPYGRLGMMMGPETHARIPVEDLQIVMEGREMVDCARPVLLQRAVKSEAEIDVISKICAIGSAAFSDLPNWVAAGQPLSDIFRDFRISLLRHGAEHVPYLVGAADQGGYSDVISPPTDKPLEDGDILMLDTGAELCGYFCDFDRNFAIGAPAPAALAAHQRLWDATEAGLEAAQVGARFCDVFAAMNKAIGGENDIGRMGHGLGSQLTEWPSVIGWEQLELAPGMVITLEPSMAVEGGKMMVAEEDILITQSGPRLLTERVQRDLVMI